MTRTLYHCSNARSFRPLWAMEEMGLDYELVVLPFPPRVRQKTYLGINPLGTIPFFVEGDVQMTESSGICQYLADVHGPSDLAVKPGEPGYGAYLNWLHFSDATLTFPQTIVLRYTMIEPEERKLAQAVEDYAGFFAGRLRAVETALETREFLVADRFTMADIAVGYGIMLASVLPPLADRITPNAKAYFERLSARDGFARAKQAQKDGAQKQDAPV